MRLALDTNVISELAKPECHPNVQAWIVDLDSLDLFLPAPCWAELKRGLFLLPHGRRRDALTTRLDALVGGLGGVLPFAKREAEVYAEVTSQAGRPRPTIDAMIAAICRANDLALATRNIRDFSDCGIRLVDPWIAG
ncbi:MAG: type II toxin-antitoxin system VapC family toxin [Propionibacteriaceae bacterium]|nr:type II toxin-antitoxin system VapC family toxin [Propionibacteriaceae bacterium]